jgi:rubredoxin
MARFRCDVCGYIHEGTAPPATCPKCGAGHDSFSPLRLPGIRRVSGKGLGIVGGLTRDTGKAQPQGPQRGLEEYNAP